MYMHKYTYIYIYKSGLGFTLMAVGQNYSPPTHAAIILSLEGVFASIASYFFLNETLNHRELTGNVVYICIYVYLFMYICLHIALNPRELTGNVVYICIYVYLFMYICLHKALNPRELTGNVVYICMFIHVYLFTYIMYWVSLRDFLPLLRVIFSEMKRYVIEN
jgi:hypothetical protein